MAHRFDAVSLKPPTHELGNVLKKIPEFLDERGLPQVLDVKSAALEDRFALIVKAFYLHRQMDKKDRNREGLEKFLLLNIDYFGLHTFMSMCVEYSLAPCIHALYILSIKDPQNRKWLVEYIFRLMSNDYRKVSNFFVHINCI